MTRLALGLLLSLVLGAASPTAAQRPGPFPNLIPRVTPAERFAHDLQASHDRFQQRLDADAQLTELRLLRQSIEQQTQEQQLEHQRRRWRHIGEDE